MKYKAIVISKYKILVIFMKNGNEINKKVYRRFFKPFTIKDAENISYKSEQVCILDQAVNRSIYSLKN